MSDIDYSVGVDDIIEQLSRIAGTLEDINISQKEVVKSLDDIERALKYREA